MSEEPRSPDADEDAATVPERPSPPGLPRWLKLSAAVVIVLILGAIAVSVLAGVEHGPGQFGPGQHGPGGDAGADPAAYAPATDGALLLALAAVDRIERGAGDPVDFGWSVPGRPG
jgi:hypothetical protein